MPLLYFEQTVQMTAGAYFFLHIMTLLLRLPPLFWPVQNPLKKLALSLPSNHTCSSIVITRTAYLISLLKTLKQMKNRYLLEYTVINGGL
jgi:hypothetical protein